MHSEAIRYVLGSIYLSLAEATALATGKPVGELLSFLMRKMAEEAPPGSADLCLFLAELGVDDSRAPPIELSPIELVSPRAGEFIVVTVRDGHQKYLGPFVNLEEAQAAILKEAHDHRVD